MQLTTEIKRWGNSLALRISGAMAELPQFREGCLVTVEITQEGLVIKKCEDKPIKLFSEKELLDDLTVENSHADELIPLTQEELSSGF